MTLLNRGALNASVMDTLNTSDDTGLSLCGKTVDESENKRHFTDAARFT